MKPTVALLRHLPRERVSRWRSTGCRPRARQDGGRRGRGGERRSRSHRLRLLRRRAPEEARRDRHRDAGGDSAPVEGDPARAREDDVPGLRNDQRAAGAVSRHAAGLGRAEPARHAAVRDIRAAPAVERQAERYGREGAPLSLSTLADQCRAGAAPGAGRGARVRSRAVAR